MIFNYFLLDDRAISRRQIGGIQKVTCVGAEWAISQFPYGPQAQEIMKMVMTDWGRFNSDGIGLRSSLIHS